MKQVRVPVIMYHSVGKINKKWIYNHLTCPYELFESQLRWIRDKKFHTISLQQLYNYMTDGDSLPKNPVLLFNANNPARIKKIRIGKIKRNLLVFTVPPKKQNMKLLTALSTFQYFPDFVQGPVDFFFRYYQGRGEPNHLVMGFLGKHSSLHQGFTEGPGGS